MSGSKLLSTENSDPALGAQFGVGLAFGMVFVAGGLFWLQKQMRKVLERGFLPGDWLADLHAEITFSGTKETQEFEKAANALLAINEPKTIPEMRVIALCHRSLAEFCKGYGDWTKFLDMMDELARRGDDGTKTYTEIVAALLLRERFEEALLICDRALATLGQSDSKPLRDLRTQIVRKADDTTRNTCEHPGCGRLRMTNSVMCEDHHLNMLAKATRR